MEKQIYYSFANAFSIMLFAWGYFHLRDRWIYWLDSVDQIKIQKYVATYNAKIRIGFGILPVATFQTQPTEFFPLSFTAEVGKS